MSMSLDTVFVAAIEADENLMEEIGGRYWSIASAVPEDVFLANTEIPYLIVNFDGFTSNTGTKDDPFDCGDDNVNMSITISANSSQQLGKLSARVRRAVHNYLIAHMGEPGIPYNTTPGGGSRQFDENGPSFWCDLTWLCNVEFDLNDNDDGKDSSSEI